MSAAGQKKKSQGGTQSRAHTEGELIILLDGRVLIVLGRPSIDESEMGLAALLSSALVVLMPNGSPALHIPTPASPDRNLSPVLVEPWGWGWEPITDWDPSSEDGPHPP